MNISFSTQDATKVTASLLVVPVFKGKPQKDAAIAHLDAAMGGGLLKALKDEKFDGSAGSTATVSTLGQIKAARIQVVGLGPSGDDVRQSLRRSLGDALRQSRKSKWTSVGLLLPEGANDAGSVLAAAEGAHLGNYRFDKYIAEDKRQADVKTMRILLAPAGGKASPEHKAALTRAEVGANGTKLARDLVNEQPAVCVPAYLAEIGKELAKEQPALKCEVFDEKKLAKMGFGMLLAVGQGSSAPPRLVHVWYTPPKGKKTSDKKLFIVGKGITFDSGGHSLKPSEFMKDMKCDMGGAAAVLGTMSAVAALEPGFEVHGVVTSAENMLDGNSYHLGDVLQSYSGKTVEIMNTDAEGRLALGDALHWSNEQGATEIIDLATLTGACMVALGPYRSALFSDHQDIIDGVLAGADQAGEDFWRLPLDRALRDQLKSPIADMKNVGTRYGGAITAALFLSEFVGDTPWAHLDIAGPAFLNEESGHIVQGGTGFPVRTLLNYIEASSAAEAADGGDEG